MSHPARVIVVEPNPWYAAGLRREWSENEIQVILRDRFSADFLRQQMKDSALVLLIIDFSQQLNDAIEMFQLAREQRSEQLQILAILDETQKTEIWKLLELGILCYFIKPISARELSQKCRSILLAAETSLSELA